MNDPNDFLQSTKDVLAQRAGNKCSNPWCAKSTSGPHSEDAKALNLGEAAHIRGARKGSARFDPAMTPQERRGITNGIWLCRGCARMIDLDPRRYTVELLYKWKREHEAALLTAMGAPPGERELRDILVRVYRNESPAALQLAVDKPQFWEQLLTAELIRDKLRPIKKGLDELEAGLIYQPLKPVETPQLPGWMMARLGEFASVVSVLAKIVTVGLPSSWGPRGEPGDPAEILHATNLLRNACQGLLEWELEVARTMFPHEFKDLFLRMRTWTHATFDQMDSLPAQILAPIENAKRGVHEVKVAFKVPDGYRALADEFWKRFNRPVR